MSKVRVLLDKFESGKSSNDYGVEYDKQPVDSLDDLSGIVSKNLGDKYVKVYIDSWKNDLVGYLCKSVPKNPKEFGVSLVNSGTKGSSKYEIYKFINPKMRSNNKIVISIKTSDTYLLVESQSTDVVNDMLSHEKHFDYYKDSM